MTSETVADRRLHPKSLILTLIRSVIIPWLLPAGAYVFFNAGSPDGMVRVLKWVPAAIMVVFVGGGITLFFSWMGWSKFRYGVGERDIVIESGVLNRNRRSIPLSRVQDVNIEQGFLARLLGLAKVKIETGGGAKDEGLLDSVSVAEAERLRQEVRGQVSKAATNEAAVQGPTTQASPAQTGDIVFDMDLGRVIMASLFSFSLFYLAAAYAVLETAGNFIAADFYSPTEWRRAAGSASLTQILLVIATILVLGVVFGAGRTILREYGFTLWKEGRRFRRERGLFTRSEVVVPLARVQLARTSTTLLRRLFGFYELSLQTLGGAVVEGKAADRQAIAPFARLDEIAHILKETGRFRLPEPEELKRVSSRRLLKKLTPLLIPVGILAMISLFIPPAALGLGVLLFVGLHAALEWRFHRYAMSGDLLFVSKGILAPRVWIAPPKSAQVITLRRSPIQRLLGLSTVVVDTAGAQALESVRVSDLSEDRARELIEALRISGRPA